MELMDVIRGRRSVRKFQDRPIPDDVLEQVLEAGRLAPSGHNCQRWRFGVVTRDDLKARLVKAAGGQDWIATAPVVLAFCSVLEDDLAARPAGDDTVAGAYFRYGKELIDYLHACPNRRAMRVFSDFPDVLIAGQQMLLAAENAGLRGCWIGYVNVEMAGEILQLPQDMACTYLMPIGYPDEEPGPIERKGRDQVVFHNTWTSR